MSNSSLFDHSLMEKFRRRAKQAAIADADFLINHVAADLEERLATVERHFENAVDLHSHTVAAERALLRSGKVGQVWRIETDMLFLNDAHEAWVRQREDLQLPAQQADLITSLLSLHLTDDTPGVLVQIKNALKPDGLFLGAMAGAGTLGELRESLLQAETELYGGVNARVYPFIDVRDAGALLQRAGFALPVSDVETLTVRYDNLFDLMRDLKAMGMQNALADRSRRPVSKRLFMRAAEIYAERFSDPDGRIRASFTFVWLSGWAPHESQQKALRPGSAKMSLVDLLEKNHDPKIQS